MLELLHELLKTEPGTLALVAIVLLAGAIVYNKTRNGRNGRNGHGRNEHRKSVEHGQGQRQGQGLSLGLPLPVLEEISRQVEHKFKNVVAPRFLELSGDIRETRDDIVRLDGAREESRIVYTEVKMRLSNIETGQVELNRKIDRLLDQQR